MSQPSSLAALARLLFRAQAELNTLLADNPLGYPLRASSAAIPRLHIQVGDRQLNLSAQHSAEPGLLLECTGDGVQYSLALTPALPGKATTLTATLTDLVTGKVTVYEGLDVLRAQVPVEFQKVHEESLQQLKALLPSTLLEQLIKRVAAEPTRSGSPLADGGVAAQNGDEPEQGASAAEAEVAVPAPTLILPQDDGPDLRFSGELLGGVRSRMHHGRWHELRVYRSKGGKFIAHQMGCSAWMHEADRSSAKVADALADALAFFGHTPLAKQLARQLNTPVVQDID